jgi:hypothetical protein
VRKRRLNCSDTKRETLDVKVGNIYEKDQSNEDAQNRERINRNKNAISNCRN